MTREEFKDNFQSYIEWRSDADSICEAATIAAEPLFEEIEKIKGSVNFWADKYGLELTKNLLEMGREIEKLKEERDREVFQRLLFANEVLQLKAQLLWWRTHGKEGMAPDVDEKS